MDRFRQKPKKEKLVKYVDKEQPPLFITDIKSIKENLKIKEILRTVKMNSSMRIKAPRGSKVMQNKDFNDNEDIFEGESNNEDQNISEYPSATNTDVVVSSSCVETNEDDTEDSVLKTPNESNGELIGESNENNSSVDTTIHESIGVSESLSDFVLISNEEKQNNSVIPDAKIDLPSPSECSYVKARDRKLSLDHTMLSRREGLSQSELDLNLIGKSPLERKSSFFRKKMDSFLKNTTEMFKRQSLSRSQSNIQRRGSMSASLQSLNENTACNGVYGEPLHDHETAELQEILSAATPQLDLADEEDDDRATAEELQGSVTSLQSSLTPARSGSSLSMYQSERTLPDPQSEGDSLAGSRPVLSGSQPLGDANSHSVHSLNEAYIQESLLNSRAISMSSGLDSALGPRSRKSRSNRVTWLASEGLTNYLRRVIQDEKSRELNVCHSYQDFSTIPENYLSGSNTDTKGRRLSYQRAVSGEDPRYHDSTIKRKQLGLENSEDGKPHNRVRSKEPAMSRSHSPAGGRGCVGGPGWPGGGGPPGGGRGGGSGGGHGGGAGGSGAGPSTSSLDPASLELSELLAGYTRNGPPELQGFCIANIEDEAHRLLLWAECPQNVEEFYDWKQLSPNEEARQAVIRELVCTEADYIRHLLSIVRVFMAVAHALQDAGKLLDVDTEKLFTNIPDVLNASLSFWEAAIYPMVADATNNQTPFNTELMSSGFMHFRETFHPYEKYVNEQTKALDYLRTLTSNTDFMTYLTWCYRQKECNRLQLSDIMVKPMQRLTKYSLLLRRIIAHTETEPERVSLRAMENCGKSYVQDLNRSIRQREELEKMERLANSIEAYEIDFKDEDLDKYFRLYAQLNLRSPMVNCLNAHCRTLIHQGELRFKDNLKEMDVRVYLLTDMILICKKLSKGSLYPYKLIRPKYMIDKLVTFTRPNPRNAKEIGSLVFVSIDDVGSSQFAFTLSESSKETNPQSTLKLWEHKLREARLTYDLAVWYSKYPARDLSEMDVDSSSDHGANAPSTTKPGIKQNSDDINIEREARERVATMLHRSMGASTDCDFSQASLGTDSFDGETSSGGRSTVLQQGLRHPMKRNSTGGSSRNSRLSSFHQSTSAASHDEPQPGPSKYTYKAGSSVEHVIPALYPDDGVTSITVNVVSESESETIVQTHQPQPPMLVLQHSSPHKSPIPSPMPSRSSSASRNTLRVQPQNVVMALVHSLPDLTFDSSPSRPQQSPTPLSASEKLYQSHQELLQRNRLSAQQHQHYLTPDHRGTSYPPPSPTRASLKRGLAFSYSFKNPPLSKMGHVNSQSQVNPEAGPSTSHGSKGDKSPTPGTSAEKPDKKSKNISSRHKGRSVSPSSRKDDKGD